MWYPWDFFPLFFNQLWYCFFFFFTVWLSDIEYELKKKKSHFRIVTSLKRALREKILGTSLIVCIVATVINRSMNPSSLLLLDRSAAVGEGEVVFTMNLEDGFVYLTVSLCKCIHFVYTVYRCVQVTQQVALLPHFQVGYWMLFYGFSALYQQSM